jgi:cytochrome c oxidase subunit 4
MANDDHGHGHAAHGHSARMYYITYLVLASCTILTFTAAQHNFGEWSFAIAMFIALVKAMFVILFFMHLWDQPGPNRLTMAIAVVFVLLLITLTLTDAATRFPLAMPPGSHRALHLGHVPFNPAIFDK